MAEPPLPPPPPSTACSPTWSSANWMSPGVLPLSSSPKIWSVSSGESSDNYMASTPAELVANLALPPPMTPSLPFLFPGDMILDDLTVTSQTPSPSITQPYFTLPPARASKCVFPPSCPVLVYHKNGCSPPEVGLVQAVVVDLNAHPMRAPTQVFYDVSVSQGTRTLHRVPEMELQFAPQCPVWFQPLHDTESQHPGVVLASYHSPHLNDSSDIFYSVRVDSPVPLVHHGVCNQQLCFRVSTIVSSTHSPIITTKRDLNRPSLLQRLDRSVPSEVLTNNASMHSVSTRSLNDPSTYMDPMSPRAVASGKKSSIKFHIPSWISDTSDLENSLLKPNTKYRSRVEQKTGCNIEIERAPEGSAARWSVTMYHDDSSRLVSSRTYVENFIIDRVHERLEGRLLYHFALDQTGQAFEPGYRVVRQRCPENRKVEVYMTAVQLPSETCVKAVIGKGGRFINFVRSMTGCTVTLESRAEITTEPFVHIFGEERDKVDEAASLIEEKIQERS